MRHVSLLLTRKTPSMPCFVIYLRSSQGEIRLLTHDDVRLFSLESQDFGRL